MLCLAESCTGHLDDVRGVIEIMFTSDNPNAMECVFYIDNERSFALGLNFLDFQLNCTNDVVNIYGGKQMSSELLLYGRYLSHQSVVAYFYFLLFRRKSEQILSPRCRRRRCGCFMVNVSNDHFTLNRFHLRSHIMLLGTRPCK